MLDYFLKHIINEIWRKTIQINEGYWQKTENIFWSCGRTVMNTETFCEPSSEADLRAIRERCYSLKQMAEPFSFYAFRDKPSRAVWAHGWELCSEFTPVPCSRIRIAASGERCSFGQSILQIVARNWNPVETAVSKLGLSLWERSGWGKWGEAQEVLSGLQGKMRGCNSECCMGGFGRRGGEKGHER